MSRPQEKRSNYLPMRKIGTKDINTNLAFANVWDALAKEAEDDEELSYLRRLSDRARREVQEALADKSRTDNDTHSTNIATDE